MKVIRRYFLINNDSQLVQNLIEGEQRKQESIDKIAELVKEVGAKDGRYSRASLLGFIFDGEPDTKLFKYVNRTGCWYPKQNIKAGKELAARMKNLKIFDPDEELLNAFGLAGGFPLIFGESKGHIATVIKGLNTERLTELPPLVIVNMPWAEFDEEFTKEIEEYKNATHWSNTSYEYLLQDHAIFGHPDAKEIKEWEYLKAVDEYNDRWRKLEAQGKEG